MAIFGPAQRAKLSVHASHLVGRLEANRDHMKISGAMFAGAVVYASHIVQKDLGAVSLGACAVLAGAAGYAALKSFQHGKVLDQKVEQLAQATGQELPEKNKVGLMDMDEAALVVARAAPMVPDLVKALSDRRERAWDRVMDPDYRPTVRPARPG